MLLEHLIYSTAFAIIAGMMYYKRTGRDHSWIIIASAFAPDIDMFAGEIFKKLDMNVLINGEPIKHGDLHNIAVMLIFAVLAGLVLKTAGIKFIDSFIFAGIGFGAHMFEDALIADPAYRFFWPISGKKFGIGIFDYRPDLYGIANTDVLIVGIIAVILCGIVRTAYEGNGSVKRTAKAFGIGTTLLILTIPVFGVLDVNVMDSAASFMDKSYIDKWLFAGNGSWDSTVFHSGKHSAKIENSGNEKISGAWMSDRIPVTPNTTHIFSSWGMTGGIGGKDSPALKVVERDVNDKWLRQTMLVFGKGTNGWTQKQIKFRTLYNTSYVNVYANVWKGYGTFWFDDVELYEDGTGNNLVLNGGFEDDVKRYFVRE